MSEALTEGNRENTRQYVRWTLYREPRPGVPLHPLLLRVRRSQRVAEADVYAARRGSGDTRRRSPASIVHTADGDALGIGNAGGDTVATAALAAPEWRADLQEQLGGGLLIDLPFERVTVYNAVGRLQPKYAQALYDLGMLEPKEATGPRRRSVRAVYAAAARAIDALILELVR